MELSALSKVRVMDYQNQETATLKKGFGTRRERFGGKSISIRDIPLEIRRKEAKKPLFLTRYE